ncbi:uncharacterized protein BCR38DRAFT_467718 [Pseudomassariella vexata]|uniref:RmlC-like cupin domain-containing protein n=1 Tax=Pseudomassariella vexata TaxID=1141098 RepID=A0A1Y2DN28_9PEZI|nr:uncharacterized protein BCR38DRAFT_467718 [Pseudomassariella vexata]ORY60661.1 hypothetical protein BCR38DRAFT_467718 [Pseudomassariella vexata]
MAPALPRRIPLLSHCIHHLFPPHLNSGGIVDPHWRYAMHSTTHFHSISYEELSISHTSASLCFGGEDNLDMLETWVEKGGVVIVPVGVGHRLLNDVDGAFEMVGSEAKIQLIAKFFWFDQDPVSGDDEPALHV